MKAITRNYWSNIEVSADDAEIIEIDNFEKSLGPLTEEVKTVRELIRRFEACHFKYQEHLKYILNAIDTGDSSIQPDKIGQYHISKGVINIKYDKTGRSKVGQQYLCSLKLWLGDKEQKNSENYNELLNLQITNFLGERKPNKEQIVRLLVARLVWDWDAYHQYLEEGRYKDLEFQVCRMDICHYAFPTQLDAIIQAIGKMKPVDNFEGCGTYSSEIKKYIQVQYLTLCDDIEFTFKARDLTDNQKIKLWLKACLAKTLKEQVGLNLPLPKFIDSQLEAAK